MIAIIPARGGSKGVPGKNIKNICGKPLIAYTIQAAQKAKGIERVIVTTDSKEIAEVAINYGAEVPFLRPEYLATDSSSAIDVYLHAVDFIMNKEHKTIDKFMVLLPTVPLRTESHIEEALNLYQETNSTTLISMKEADTPASWYYLIDSNGNARNAGFGKESAVANRQKNEVYYVPNGAIYILDYNLLKTKKNYYCEKTVVYKMDREESVDIDYPIDFILAEALMKERLISNK